MTTTKQNSAAFSKRGVSCGGVQRFMNTMNRTTAVQPPTFPGTQFLRRIEVLSLRIFLVISVALATLTSIELLNRATLRVPPTWSEQVVTFCASQSHGIADLYSINHLYTPPFMICIYPPGYYATLKMLGSSIAVGR